MRPTLSLLIVAVMAVAIQAHQPPAVTVLAEVAVPAPAVPAPTVSIVQDNGLPSEVAVQIDDLGPVRRFLLKRIAKRAFSDRDGLLRRFRR